MSNEISSIGQPLTPPPPPTAKRSAKHPAHDTLAIAANLANLLPTGTVLAFQTLIPSFSSNGNCQKFTNKFLTSLVIFTCAFFCFLSSFTDSFVDNENGKKLYYGIATFKGMYVFNYNDVMEEDMSKCLKKYRIRFIDFVHAFISLVVFLVFALTNSNVQTCFFNGEEIYVSELAMKLPLGVGLLSTFLFTIFPTTRRGIGYGDPTSNQATTHPSSALNTSEVC